MVCYEINRLLQIEFWMYIWIETQIEIDVNLKV